MTARACFFKLRRAAVDGAATLPFMPFLLRKAATAPPSLKSALATRIASALAARLYSNSSELIETNLGMPGHMRVFLPASNHRELFGRPDLNPAERGITHLALCCLRDSDAFLDVGANEGLFTFLVAQAWGKDRHEDIHLFEPDPDIYGRLMKNLAINGIEAIVNCAALSDNIGTQIFNRNLDDDKSGSLTDAFQGKHRTEPLTVDVTTLADYLVARDIRDACIKIDVEGAGVAVWDGLAPAIDRVKWLLIEIIGPEDKAHLPARITAETGWHGYYICDRQLIHSSAYGVYVPPFFNWLFCAYSPEELTARLVSTDFEVVAATAHPGLHGSERHRQAG